MDALDIPQTGDLCHDLSVFLNDIWNWRRFRLDTMRMLQGWRNELLQEECSA